MAFGIRMMSTALWRRSAATVPDLSRFPWGEFGELLDRGLHLARALDLFALGSAARNLRQAFDLAQAEAWIAARGRAEAEKCARFRATVYGSTPRRPGLARRFPIPVAKKPDARNISSCR